MPIYDTGSCRSFKVSQMCTKNVFLLLKILYEHCIINKGFLKKEHFSVWKEYCQTFWTSISDGDHWRSRGVQKKHTPSPFSLTLSALLPIFFVQPACLLL